MTAKKTLGIVLLWGVTFASIGGLIGATLGTFAPDYYRSVIRDGHDPDFNPFQVGIGLGVTQGLASGVAMALGIFALFAWRDLRSAPLEVPGKSAGHSQQRLSRGQIVLCGVATALSVIVLSIAAFVLGGIVGQQQLYEAWTDRKLQKIATILQSEAFPDVRADHSSAAQVYLTGTVKDEATRHSLHDKLVLAFGSEEASEMLWRVDVGAINEADELSKAAPLHGRESKAEFQRVPGTLRESQKPR